MESVTHTVASRQIYTQSITVFPCQYYSTNVLCSYFIHLQPTVYSISKRQRRYTKHTHTHTYIYIYIYSFVVYVIFSSRRNKSVTTARGNSNPSDSNQTTKQNGAEARDGTTVLQCFVFIRGLRSDSNDERANYSPKTYKRKEKAERN